MDDRSASITLGRSPFYRRYFHKRALDLAGIRPWSPKNRFKRILRPVQLWRINKQREKRRKGRSERESVSSSEQCRILASCRMQISSENCSFQVARTPIAFPFRLHSTVLLDTMFQKGCRLKY